MKPVDIDQLAEQLDMGFDDSVGFVDPETGELIWLELDGVGMIEDGATWEEVEAASAHWASDISREDFDRWDRLIAMPSQRELGGYGMMCDFIDGLDDGRAADALARAIQGSGAFRRFKDVAYSAGLLEDWFAYKHEAVVEFAKDWCGQEGIAWEYRRPQPFPPAAQEPAKEPGAIEVTVTLDRALVRAASELTGIEDVSALLAWALKAAVEE
ncbi:MAG: UPF0158 family protein [Bifidobacteriaceae bacterium]|jgi:hypothetical protein|nr:UPF0158 family protein [Bifidobacteriaceae bacterium]